MDNLKATRTTKNIPLVFLNKNETQPSIPRVLWKGDWRWKILIRFKNEFLNIQESVLIDPKSVDRMLNMEFHHHLNSMQQLDHMEADSVQMKRLKKRFWDIVVAFQMVEDIHPIITRLIPKTPSKQNVKGIHSRIILIGLSSNLSNSKLFSVRFVVSEDNVCKAANRILVVVP
ncbi:hypothetical protein Tco_0620921 [Tanacetum coccineum]